MYEKLVSYAARQLELDASDISPDSITAQVENLIRKLSRSNRTKAEREEKRSFEERTGGRKDLDRMRLFNAEKLILNLICEKDVFKLISPELSPADFTEGIHRRLAEIIYSTHENGEKLRPMSIISQFGEEDSGRVSELLSDDKNVENAKEAAMQSLKIIKEYHLKQAAMSDDTDAAKLQEIMDKLKKDKK